MSSTPLLNDIKAAYRRGYAPHSINTDHEHHKIRHDIAENHISSSAREDARRQLEEHLSLLCTSILIGGEQFVREFPSLLYVPVLTDILIAAHAPPPGSGDGVNPLVWDVEEGSMASMTKIGKKPHSAAGMHHGRERLSAAPLPIHYAGFQIASPTELLAIRALALIAGDVPRGSYAFRVVKSPLTISVLAAYLTDSEFLVVNDELTEELLKCFLYLTLAASETCVDANVPRRVVELLLIVEQHHLRLLCVQILSNMLARAREKDLEDVWVPVLSLLMESLSAFVLNSPYHPEMAVHSTSMSLQSRLSATWADNAPSQQGSFLGVGPADTRAHRNVTLKDQTLLMHYVESIVHALDRLFVEVAAMECHIDLIEQFVKVSVQLLRISVLINSFEDRWVVRSLALSPLTTLYLCKPSFAVPLMLRLRMWETVCGCMLATIERKQLEPVGERMVAPAFPASAGSPINGAADDATVVDNADASRTSAAVAPASGSPTSVSSALSNGDASSNTTGHGEDAASVMQNEGTSAQPNAASIASGPVLTTNVMTIPFISDEQELLPMLEFLLLLMPCARSGHSHCDYRDTTGPHFRWTWEDDFHNEMECNESLCRRLERAYQLTRNFRSHECYAMTHGKQRVFYADFLSKVYVSDRKQRHALHRRPLIAGFVHDSRNAFLKGCTCCVTDPDPLFITWANRSNMHLRTADPTVGSSGGYASDNAANPENATGAADANGSEGQRGLARSSSAPSSLNNSLTAHRSARDGTPTSNAGYAALNSGSNGGDGGTGRSISSGVQHFTLSSAAATTASTASPSEASAAVNRQHPGEGVPSTSRGRGGTSARGTTSSPARLPRHQLALQDDDDGDYEASESMHEELGSTYQSSQRSAHQSISLCCCGGPSSTVAHRAPARRLRLQDSIGAATPRDHKQPSVTISLIPLEAMLEDPVEKLQSDPATRKAFLGKDVLSHLLPTMIPALLSLLDNCVNPLVARHSLILLLRCLSLCADLRTQVTGDVIEISLPSDAAAAASAKSSAATGTTLRKLKDGKRFASFRKWITGSSGTTAPRWLRNEWQATKTTLQCFLPALRDLFVGLYLMEGVHIVAGRQDVFGAMKDDLVMTDELARIHIAPEFCSFHLSVPSEQLTTSADAMVLLLGLFPQANPASMPSATPAKASAKNSIASARKVQRNSHADTAAASASQELPLESLTSLVKPAHDLRRNDTSTLSLLPPFLPGFLVDGAMAAAGSETSPHAIVTASPITLHCTAELKAQLGDGEQHHDPPASPTERMSLRVSGASAGAGGAQFGRVSHPHSLSLRLPTHSAPAAKNVSLESSRDCPNNEGTSQLMPATPPSSVSSVVNSTDSRSSGCGVFTAHQVMLLLNYARQVISRGPPVCAVASQIEQSMQSSEFNTVVVLGSSEASAGTLAMPLRTKELTLRTSPAASCPYHFSFTHCTENFFDASQSLFHALKKLGVEFPTSTTVGGTPSNSNTFISDALVHPKNGPDGADGPLSRPQANSSSSAASAIFSLPADTSSHSRPTAPSAGTGSIGGERRSSDNSNLSPMNNNNGRGSKRSSNESGALGAARSSVPTALPNATPQERNKSSTLDGQSQPATEEEVLPVDVNLSAAPKTVDIDALYDVVNKAVAEATGPYQHLPPPLRAVLSFYDYCKGRDIELRAVIVEEPYFMRGMADALKRWFNTVVRTREDEALSSSYSFSLLDADGGGSPNSASRMPLSGSSSRHLRLDSTTRGKILCLVSELGSTVSRDLGFATFSLDTSIVVKQPCSFSKRLRRMRSYGAVRHLVYRPLVVSFEMLSCGTALLTSWPKTSEGEIKSRERTPVVTVRSMALPVVSGVRLRKTGFSVLPNTTIGDLAAALAKQLQLTALSPAPRTPTSYRRTMKCSPIVFPLHTTLERMCSPDQSMLPALTDSSPCFTSEEVFEDPNSSGIRAVSANRVLLFINNEPMLSPLTKLLDALISYAETGSSLRSLVTMPQQAGDSDEVHRNKVLMTLPTLPFWLCKHKIKYVVLEEPLPTSLLTGNTLTSVWSVPNSRRCGCSGIEPNFLCSPKHLFEVAPVNGSVALYAVLTAIARSEIADAASVLDSSQRRLSSAVVHQLYQHLSMFMFPPLLYSCGIGAAVPGSSIRAVSQARSSHPNMAFPTASYALWAYPFMFSMDMRVSILRFFMSAQRSLSLEQCRHILHGHQHLLVRRAVGEPNFGSEETWAGEGGSDTSPRQGGSADRRLDVVGLEWLSEEVLRRRRVTLTVNRRRILQSAEQLFTLATCTLTLDVAFKGEAGIGLGPAMEFYELVVEELLKPQYGLFRTEEVVRDDEVENYAGISCSLQLSGVSQISPPPQPLRRRSCNPLYPAGKQTPQTLHYWELLGLVLGRLLMMGETSSLNFHPLFLRRMLGEEIMVNATPPITNNLELLDAPLASSLLQLTMMSEAELEMCDLYFTIPVSEADGFSPAVDVEVPMLEGGERRRVTKTNVQEYVGRMYSHYLQTVPDLALLHLRRGLQHTVNPLYLELFSVAELGRLLGSPNDAKIWESREHFARNIEAGHGYHKRSDVVQHLLDVVPQWNAQLQHQFLKFVTGSSCVPYGGLTQVIKVVRRDVERSNTTLEISTSRQNGFCATDSAANGANGVAVRGSAVSGTTLNNTFVPNTAHDDTLPTVSTCFLYLKLPPYSSKAVLEERLRFAVCEGSNFFALT